MHRHARKFALSCSFIQEMERVFYHEFLIHDNNTLLLLSMKNQFNRM